MRVAVGSGNPIKKAAVEQAIASRVRDGEELGPVMDAHLGTAGIATREGAAGALTDGAIDRESALADAVGAAFGPFLTDLY